MKRVTMSGIKTVSVLKYLFLALEEILSLKMEGTRFILSVILCYKITVHRGCPTALQEIPG
jgi:hypothetical protein